MPALKPAPGAVQVKVNYTVDSRGVSFSLYYSDGAGEEYTTADVADLLGALDAAWVTSLYPQLSNHAVGVSYVGTDLFSETAPRVEAPASWVGGVSTEPVPLNVAAVIKGVQDRRYRGGKSHIYIAGYPDADRSSSALWSTSAITNLAAGVAAGDTAALALTTSHSFNWVPVTVSRFNAKVERTTPVLFHITGRAPEIRICTRRRRLPKIAG